MPKKFRYAINYRSTVYDQVSWCILLTLNSVMHQWLFIMQWGH